MENKENKIFKPEMFYAKDKKDLDNFNLLLKTKNPTLIDTLGEQKFELSLIEDPSLISHQALYERKEINTRDDEGVWFYFPWKNTAVRILEEELYFKLRSARNKNLITEEEQKMLRSKKVGIVGLNVGNPGAVCIALESIASNFKLSDLDHLSVSNLNRFHAGLTDVGINKAHITARQIYEINPYAQIKMYDHGINNENLEDFLIGERKLDILIEEMDILKLKIAIRETAKDQKIPVIMVTGNGENVLIDVERYDIEPDLPILSGLLKNETISNINSIEPEKGTYEERIKLAQDFMGEEYLDERLNASFKEVGKSLSGIPQLAESSYLRGATIAHFAKKILLGEDVKSGRYEIKLSGNKIK